MFFRSPFSLYDRLYFSLFYALRLRRYDLPERRVGWQSRHNQEKRFEALAGLGDLTGASLLDLGSGLGCLYGYLLEKGWRGAYTGVDLLGAMTRESRKRFPGARFETRDILSHPPTEQWDYVLISGVFNHRVRDNWGWIDQIVGRSRGLARRGIAFNLLSAEAGAWDPELFYANPKEVERRAESWSGGNYKIVTGYLPGDMTVYLYKS